MKWIILLLLLIPLTLAYDVDITLNSKDIVAEHITIDVPGEYDAYEFYVPYKPLGIIYEGEHSLSDDKITFFNNGKDILEFTLIYSDMIESTGSEKSFRASFDNADKITITLPEKNILSKEPGTIPEPDTKTTDGTHIILTWTDTSSIAVFYEGEKKNIFAAFIFAIIAFILLSLAMTIYSRKKSQEKIASILSDDENLILSEIKKGTVKQKEIAKKLNFSKSKMSKVIRKLEEKNLIEKKPHFKTNILKLK